MQPEDLREQVDQLLKEYKQLIKYVASHASTARLLAENEPIGELVMLSLMDDPQPYSDLGARFKIISDWLKETEEGYRSQFPEDFPMQGRHYDLSRKPDGFKTRLEIFTEIVEKSELESTELWSTELLLNDPVLVVKKFRLSE
jgi:hypothetical protein